MPARPKHMLMFAGVDTLDTCSRIIHMANAFCDAGTKVSLICPPQRRDNSAELKQVLHPAANVYIALGSVGQVLNIRYVSGSAEAHLPEAACYQLAEYACLPRPRSMTSLRIRTLRYSNSTFPLICTRNTKK